MVPKNSYYNGNPKDNNSPLDEKRQKSNVKSSHQKKRSLELDHDDGTHAKSNVLNKNAGKYKDEKVNENESESENREQEEDFLLSNKENTPMMSRQVECDLFHSIMITT